MHDVVDWLEHLEPEDPQVAKPAKAEFAHHQNISASVLEKTLSTPRRRSSMSEASPLGVLHCRPVGPVRREGASGLKDSGVGATHSQIATIDVRRSVNQSPTPSQDLILPFSPPATTTSPFVSPLQGPNQWLEGPLPQRASTSVGQAVGPSILPPRPGTVAATSRPAVSRSSRWSTSPPECYFRSAQQQFTTSRASSCTAPRQTSPRMAMLPEPARPLSSLLQYV